MSSALEILKKRTSANNFNNSKQMSESDIRELISYACEAPSSFNIQHWRFVAVTEKDVKEKLKAVAFGQQKISDAAVTFAVLGDLKGIDKLSEAISPMLKSGAIDQKAYDGWLGMASGMYKDNPQLVRDEAIRSASLAGMNLMIAAQAKGLVSGAMVGFDSEGVKKVLGISDRYVPVMLIAVGPEAPGNWPRKPRFSVDQVLSLNKFKEF